MMKIAVMLCGSVQAQVDRELMFGTDNTIKGYYSWSWDSGSVGQSGANAGAAFTGHAVLSRAIKEYNSDNPELKGTKYITLGGGNKAGRFTKARVNDITDGVQDIVDAGYEGVIFDIEEVAGSSDKMIPQFEACFKACKEKGLIVGITVSHSAPYHTNTKADAVAFVKSWVKDSNIDFISPQVYSDGDEPEPEFAETSTCKSAGCTWDLYKDSIPKFVPSIVDSSQYEATQKYFKKHYSITAKGYFQWAQVTRQVSSRKLAYSMNSTMKGYYSLSWGTGSVGQTDANAGAAYTAYASLAKAIAGYTSSDPKLRGTKYITLGGPTAAGAFTKSLVEEVTNGVSSITTAGYEGVIWDLEQIVGSSETMIPVFAASFKALKEAGLKVGITVSHSAPYECYSAADAVAFVKAWVKDDNVDFISPQLYSNGDESTPEYTETSSCQSAGCTWSLYKDATVDVIPSIVDASQYAAVQKKFRDDYSITTQGYFQWKQVAPKKRSSFRR